LLIPLVLTLSFSIFSLLLPPPPRSTLFPYTTLFRSGEGGPRRGHFLRQLLRFRCVASPLFTTLGVVETESQFGRVPSAGIFKHRDRKSTRLNSSHLGISYAVFCLKKKKKTIMTDYII